jgi:hypothetical protein
MIFFVFSYSGASLTAVALNAQTAMFFAIALVSLIAAASADLPDILKGKVEAITGIASMACSNKYINNTEEAFTIDDVLCDTKLVPKQFQDYIPEPQVRPGLGHLRRLRVRAALPRLRRCDVPRRGEDRHRDRQGRVVRRARRPQCDDVPGDWQVHHVGPAHGPQARRRGGHGLMAPFTQEEFAEEVAVVKAAPKPEVTAEADMHFVKLLVRSYFPAEAAAHNNLGLAADDTLENYMARKRDTVDEILKQAQLCNPIISAGVNLLVAQVPTLDIIKDKFGPCGLFCELAMCGLTLMCHTVSRSALLSLEAQRMAEGCNKTSCSKWAPPLNVCMNAPACNNADGPVRARHARPEHVRAAEADLLGRPAERERLLRPLRRQVLAGGVPDAPRGGLRRAAVAAVQAVRCGPRGPVPMLPDVHRHVQDVATPCTPSSQSANCPPPPMSCGAGKMIGPANPGTCCLTCVDPCVGVPCPNAPTEASCKAQGKTYQLKDRASLATSANPQCADCCPQCVGGSSVDVKTEKPNTAVTNVVAASAAILASVALLF